MTPCSRLVLVALFALPCLGVSASSGWHAGTWDSSIYWRADHPKTVALRFEIRDANTGTAVPSASIKLKGTYLDEKLGGSDIGMGYQPQEREFEMAAHTGEDGVAVFALSWRKTFPWDTGRPQNRNVHTAWTRAIDDIEKVQHVEIRHARYRQQRVPLNFSQLTEVGQDKTRATQVDEVHETFRNAWQSEMRRETAKFCVLNLGTSFPDYQNPSCSREEFFQAVRAKTYGSIYTEPSHFFSRGEHPQSECGPYFVYLFEFEMDPVAQQIEVVPTPSSDFSPAIPGIQTARQIVREAGERGFRNTDQVRNAASRIEHSLASQGIDVADVKESVKHEVTPTIEYVGKSDFGKNVKQKLHSGSTASNPGSPDSTGRIRLVMRSLIENVRKTLGL